MVDIPDFVVRASRVVRLPPLHRDAELGRLQRDLVPTECFGGGASKAHVDWKARDRLGLVDIWHPW